MCTRYKKLRARFQYLFLSTRNELSQFPLAALRLLRVQLRAKAHGVTCLISVGEVILRIFVLATSDGGSSSSENFSFLILMHILWGAKQDEKVTQTFPLGDR
jgi:hypothetical protein